mgnify:FL=1|jgi:hypothetical protein
MRLTKEQRKKENPLLDDRQLRDKCVGRYEVLDKVKELLLLPGTELATVKQVAEFYEVGEEAIVAVYSRHSDELETDGMKVVKYKDLSNLQYESLKTSKGKVTFIFKDGNILDFPTRGQKVFPRRAILRVGMLLRDSDVAKEVRNQLLNIEEKTSTETKIEDIEEEQKLMLSVGMAVASGDANAVAIASANLVAFKNRHIEKLQNDNKALAGGILAWSDRSKLNAGVRQLSAVTGIPFGNVWNELYKNLQYKYGICLKQRGGKPFIQWVEESEWDNVIKTFCAMCEAYNQSPTEMFQQTTPEIKA